VSGGIVISTEQVLTRMAAMAREAGVKPEVELFDSGAAVLAKHLIGKGVLDGPGMYSFVMGLNFAVPADTESMMYPPPDGHLKFPRGLWMLRGARSGPVTGSRAGGHRATRRSEPLTL